MSIADLTLEDAAEAAFDFAEKHPKELSELGYSALFAVTSVVTRRSLRKALLALGFSPVQAKKIPTVVAGTAFIAAVNIATAKRLYDKMYGDD